MSTLGCCRMLAEIQLKRMEEFESEVKKLRLRDKTSGYPTLQRSHLWEKSYVLSTKQKALIGFHSTLLTNPEEM